MRDPGLVRRLASGRGCAVAGKRRSGGRSGLYEECCTVSGSCRVTAWAVCVERRGVAVLRSQYIPSDCTELGRRLLWDMVLYVQYVPDCRGGAGLLSQTARDVL
jgi:hypothetical protein